MTTFVITAPDGTKYQVTGPDGATEQDALAQVQAQHPVQNVAPASTSGHALGIGARGLTEGAASAATFVPDTLLNNPEIAGMLPPPFSLIANAFRGSGQTPANVMTGSPTFQGALEQGMTAAGAPVPQTSGEKLGYAAAKGAGMAATGGAGLGASGANLLRAGVAGASGATASEATKQAGGGPLLQLGAGLAGGLTPAGLEGALRATGRATGALVAPFFKAGQEGIAGRTIASAATNPATAGPKAAAGADAVPGSQATTAEITRDPGLASLETRLRQLSPEKFNPTDSARHQAREALLDSMASTNPEIKALEIQRDTATTALRDTAMKQASGKQVPIANVLARVDDLLADPENAGKSVQSALKDVRSQIEGKTDARALYAVRKEINRILEGKYVGADESILRYAGGQLGKVKGAIDDAIGSIAPAWKGYLNRYAEMSKPIDRAEALADIRSKTSLAASDLSTAARLSQAKWTNVVSKNLPELSKTLAPDEITKVRQIANDLDRGAAVEAAGRVSGSPTAANLIADKQLTIANLIGRTFNRKLSEPPISVASVLRPISFIYALPESRVRQLVVDAMLDPKLAARLMQKATPQNVTSFVEMLKIGGSAGTLAAAANTRSTGAVPATARQMGTP